MKSCCIWSGGAAAVMPWNVFSLTTVSHVGRKWCFHPASCPTQSVIPSLCSVITLVQYSCNCCFHIHRVSQMTSAGVLCFLLFVFLCCYLQAQIKSSGGGSPRKKRKQSMSLSRCKSDCKKSHFYWNSMPHLSIVSPQMGCTARYIPTDTWFITCMMSCYLIHVDKLGAGGL